MKNLISTVIGFLKEMLELIFVGDEYGDGEKWSLNVTPSVQKNFSFKDDRPVSDTRVRYFITRHPKSGNLHVVLFSVGEGYLEMLSEFLETEGLHSATEYGGGEILFIKETSGSPQQSRYMSYANELGCAMEEHIRAFNEIFWPGSTCFIQGATCSEHTTAERRAGKKVSRKSTLVFG